jgi:hypothetical protein
VRAVPFKQKLGASWLHSLYCPRRDDGEELFAIDFLYAQQNDCSLPVEIIDQIALANQLSGR